MVCVLCDKREPWRVVGRRGVWPGIGRESQGRSVQEAELEGQDGNR